MTNRSFAVFVAGAFAATFTGVLVWPVAPARSLAMDSIVDEMGTDAATGTADVGTEAASGTAAVMTEAADVYYPGCRAVRTAGKAPLHRGQPGYRPEMDGDGDGIACEPRVADGSDGGSYQYRWRRRR